MQIPNLPRTSSLANSAIEVFHSIWNVSSYYCLSNIYNNLAVYEDSVVMLEVVIMHEPTASALSITSHPSAP